jgi:succinate dehydrogenase / fumarate reductase cytochrome b subunit
VALVPETRPDLSKRLLTLTGVVPLALFLVEHIVLNASSLGGASRWDAVVGRVARSGLAQPIEIGLILIPLGYHMLYGVHMLTSRRPSFRTYPLLPERMVFLQRLTSVVLLVFVGAHLWELRIHRWRTALPVSAMHARLVEHLTWTMWGIPWIAIGYLFGIAAATFHLANGLWAYGVDRKGIVDPGEKKRAAIVPFGLGIVLFLIGTTTVVVLTNGGSLLPEPQLGDSPCGQAVPTPSASASGPP